MNDRDSKNEGDQDDVNLKQDKPILDGEDLPDDHNNMKIGNNVLEDTRQLASTDDGASEKPISSKEQAVINHEALGLDKCNDLSNSKLPNDQAPNTLHDSGGSTSKDEIPPSSEEPRKGIMVKEPCHPVEELKDGHVSDSLLSEKNELQQSIKSNILGKDPQPVETPKDAEMASDSMPLDKSKPQNLLSTNPIHESLETTDSVMDVDMVSSSLPSEKSESQPLFASVSSQLNGIEKDVDMMSPSLPVRSNSDAENGANTGLSLSLISLSLTHPHTYTQKKGMQ